MNYSYDAAGNVVSMRSQNTNGGAVDYGYDELNRLKTVTDAAPSNPSASNPRLATGATSYTYDPVGNLTGYVHPNGAQTSNTHNTLNRLTSVSSVNAQQSPLSSSTYELGPAGNRLSVTDLNAREALILSFTKSEGPSHVTAITMLARVEPLFRRSSRSGRFVRLGLVESRSEVERGCAVMLLESDRERV